MKITFCRVDMDTLSFPGVTKQIFSSQTSAKVIHYISYITISAMANDDQGARFDLLR